MSTFWDIPVGTAMPDGWVKSHSHRLEKDGWGIAINVVGGETRFLLYDPMNQRVGLAETLAEAKAAVLEMRPPA